MRVSLSCGGVRHQRTRVVIAGAVLLASRTRSGARQEIGATRTAWKHLFAYRHEAADILKIHPLRYANDLILDLDDVERSSCRDATAGLGARWWCRLRDDCALFQRWVELQSITMYDEWRCPHSTSSAPPRSSAASASLAPTDHILGVSWWSWRLDDMVVHHDDFAYVGTILVEGRFEPFKRASTELATFDRERACGVEADRY